MAGASPHERESATSSRQSVGRLSPRNPFLVAVRTIGFWTAIVSPVILTVLFVSGLAVARPSVVVALVAVNLVGLVLGRDHKR